MAKPPLPPFLLQVLTSELLIEGTAPGDTPIYFTKPNEIGTPIPLTNVQVQSTRSTEASIHTCSNYVFTRNNAVAFIPHMDITQIFLYSAFKQYKNAISGVFHLGPYRMTGRMMTSSGNDLVGDLPIYEVRIVSQVAGTHWGGLEVPFAQVNGFWLHGWEPD